MKLATATRIAQAIKLLKLDGSEDYTNRQLADASGVTTKTISRNKDFVTILDFAINKEGYQKWIIHSA